MKEFSFVSHYKCDLIRQAVSIFFVSASSESNAEQATVVRQPCGHALFFILFCSNPLCCHSSSHLFGVAVALTYLHLARFKSNQCYLHRCIINFKICKTYDIIYPYTPSFDKDKPLQT